MRHHLASAAVGTLIVGVPAALIDRLGAGLLPMRATDIPLALLALGSILVAKAIVDRDSRLSPTASSPTSPMWQAHLLVEESLVGAGHHRVPRSADSGAQPGSQAGGLAGSLAALQPAGGCIEAYLPAPLAVAPPIPEPTPVALDGAEFVGFDPNRAVPYIVERGDTFWSIAERLTGVGSNWKLLSELNLGREVAPGVFLAEAAELKIGWTILIPDDRALAEAWR